MTKNTYKKQKNTFKYLVGIDEAGRGPLAGPVAVGIFCVEMSKTVTQTNKNLRKLFVDAKDSKKMSHKKRVEVFEKIKSAQKGKKIEYFVFMESAKNIDKNGISWAIKNCIKRGLSKLKVDPRETLVLLDGSLKAPKEYINQKTIIKGDDKEIVISLASICAKVNRDRYMVKIAKKYPKYAFDIHKGYGTLKHRTFISKYGVTEEHRKTFLRNLIK